MTKHKTILVVDDDNRIRNLLSKYLAENGYFVIAAEDAENATRILNSSTVDLIVLDVMMPKQSGITLTSKIRENNNKIPILILSALSDSESRISGLEIGADDYLTKPFEPKELLLRASKLIDRNNNNSQVVEFGKFSYNISSRKLYNNQDHIPLTSSETALIDILCKNINNPVSREEITKLFFGVGERTIDVQIVRLRNKLEIDPKNPKHLITVRNIGYGLYT